MEEQTERLNWYALKKNQCPKCNKDLNWKHNYRTLMCENVGCGFSISQQKFQQIISSMVSREIELSHGTFSNDAFDDDSRTRREEDTDDIL